MNASMDGREVAVEEARIKTSMAMNSVPEYSNSSVKKARLESALAALLADPLLADVPKKPSLSDVDTLVNLELGSAMRITIRKLDSTSFETVMMNSATVKDLKLAIKKKVNDMEESKMGHRHISCMKKIPPETEKISCLIHGKHVWSNFCLSYHNEKLHDDSSSLQDYGIRNNSEVQFIPYVVSRASAKHSKSRRHRIFRGLNSKS